MKIFTYPLGSALLRPALALSFLLVLALGTTLPLSAAEPPSDISPLEPASSGGLAALDRALVRLSSHRRLMVLAAHPDDEDTTLLTVIARGQGGEAAYLSLSRGDGGQNLIGSETGSSLGLLRSRELAAARQIDGARQYFTRAYDFGYTRSMDETLERWPEDILLEDALRVVRRFKPQVLVAVFPPTAAAGHGQHQASGWVAEKVFELAPQEEQFAQLLQENLPPWSIDTFYRGAWWAPNAEAVETPMGVIEPWSGRSILQIALESRSQHRCQDMGSIQPLGDFTGRLQWVAGRGGPQDPLWHGIDTSVSAIAQLIPEATLPEATLPQATQPNADLRAEVARRLDEVGALATTARQQLRPDDLSQVRQAVGSIVQLLGETRALLDDATAADATELSGAQHARELIDEKLWIAREAYANASNILADAVAESEILVPGEPFEGRSIFWNAGSGKVENLRVEVVHPPAWQVLGSQPPEAARSRFRTQVSDEQVHSIQVADSATPSLPYFLEQPRQGDLYRWDAVPSEVRGEPFEPARLKMRFHFDLDGIPMQLSREIVSRQRDQARGEVRRPLRVVPAVEVRVGPALVVHSLSAEAPSHTLKVDVTSNTEAPQVLQVEVVVPAGWPAMAAVKVRIQEPFGQAQVELPLQLPADLASGRQRLNVRVVDAAGRTFSAAYPLVDYEHIRPTPRFEPAAVEWVTADIRLPQLDRIGYVRGASDSLPELLQAVDLPVEVLSAETLATGDLSSYDAIVIGSRAYEIDKTLLRANPRLLDYTRGGGLLIVQYQQYQFVRGDYAPFPLDIARPHDRITDETAAVTLLAPQHPVFRHPNVLGADDWLGWVQERGLYFAGTWDDAYRPLLSMADPQGDAKTGGLLIAPLGEGTYVYTGLAFFRQLPAGIPGAYRLFANLLALQQETAFE